MDSLRAFEQAVDRRPERTAVVTLDGTAYTYEALDRRSNALARALHDRLGEERSASLLANGPAALEVFVAAQKRGIANVPLNTRASVPEQAFMAQNADARTLVFDDANAGSAADVLDRTGFDTALQVGSAPVRTDAAVIDSYDAAIEATDDDPVSRDEPDEAGVYYTSGTSGKPKGVLADREMTWYASTSAALGVGLGPDDVGLLATPLFHSVSASSWAMPHLQVGATLVPQPSFDPAGALDAIETHGVTGLLAVPTQLRALLDAQRDDPRDLTSLGRVRTGGAPLDPDLAEAVREDLTEHLYNAYGVTEGIGSMTLAEPAVQRDHPGSVGRPTFNWDVRVIEPGDPSTAPDLSATVDRGEEGEVVGRGPSAAGGYIDRPEAEATVFVDGWVRTGDVARVADDGTLYVVDRIDNMIVSGGENIYPGPVEGVLESHPAVREAAVIGVPHETWGETVKAVVVGGDGTVTADDLDAYCKASDELADYKRPRRYEIVDEPLPRSPLGKLRRGMIEDEYG